MISVTFSSFVKLSQAFRQSTLPLLLGIMSQAHAQSLDSFSSCWSQKLMISHQSSAYLTLILWMLNTLTLIDQPATPISILSATAVCLSDFTHQSRSGLQACSLGLPPPQLSPGSISRPLLSSLISLSSLSLLCFSLHSTHFTGSFLRLHLLCISPLPQLSFGLFCLSSACHIGFYPPPHPHFHFQAISICN